ncbi:capsular polysaccharide synthesis enzyme Cap5I [Catenovulum agarivorans DS-2]|uniref:Capsular polysaccharide synthesis enzyme Cap5I n=1 Tax=Catenovulum agarivorans DS-2 TaxID=1328313 RepID=W7QKK2_9ALTE|nr:hypothetical protein [Catenovulum agarivorans]EWH09487.1 capsular polysaccharide synthesis enzyme Cap5I [Catenovulum agarivorans DS-2]
MINKKILFVFKNPIIKCPRPRRLALTIANKHEVSYLCPAEINESEQQDIKRFGYLYRKIQSPFIRYLKKVSIKCGLFKLASWIESDRYEFPLISDGQFDIIFVHDLYLFPYFSHFTKTKVIFDAREYYPLEMADDTVWRNTDGKLAEYTCKKYLKKPYKMLTVSNSLVEMYQSMLKRDVHYFPSYPREELRIREPNLNSQFPLRFIHHGAAIENRGIERMIELMRLLGDDYQLDLMLVPMMKGNYIGKLKAMAADLRNVRFINTVHPDDIIGTCAEYDLGLYIMSINESQNRYCLPNKFFEFIFAGLPVITSFSQDMKTLIDKNDLGVGFLEESIEEIAESIRQLTTADIARFKQNVAEKTKTWTTANNIRSNFPELEL